MSTGASSKGNDAFENPFDALHDDLLISIMAALSASANSAADLAKAKMTCVSCNSPQFEVSFYIIFSVSCLVLSIYS
jgi:hypothetical protein